MSLAVLADHMASRGRGPDSMLIHMSPNEVAGLQALANQHGGSLTINPETGLPEAGFLDKLLPTIIGAGISYFSGGTIDPMTAAAMVGGAETVRTGDISRGLQAGLGAYGGASLTAGMSAAGTGALTAEGAALAGVDAAALGTAQGYSPELIAAMKQQAIDEAALQGGTQFTAGESLSKGFDLAKANPMQAVKDYAKPLMYAAGPAILAAASTEEGMPKTVTQPGKIAPYSYFGGRYIAGNPYEVAPTKSANGGLMAMAAGGMAGYGDGDDVPRRVDNGMAQGGMYEFAQRSEPVLRMADGGILKMAGGTPPAMLTDEQLYQQTGSWEAAAAARDQQNRALNIYNDAQRLATAVGATAPTQAVAVPGVVDTTKPGQYVTDPATGNAVALSAYSPGFDPNNKLTQTYLGELAAKGGTDTTSQMFNQMGASQAQQDANAAAWATEKARLDALDAAKAPTGLAGLNQNLLTNQNQGAGLTALIPADASYTNRFFAERGLGFDPIDKAIDNFFAEYTDDLALMTPQAQEKVMRDALATERMNEADVIKATGKTIAQHIQQKQQQRGDGSVIVPGNLDQVPVSSLPGGVSGAGNTVINPNGTITTRPDFSLGMGDVRNMYTQGGGKLGITPSFVPKTVAEMEERYPLRGGTKQAYETLMGRRDYDPVPFTKTGEIAKPYNESVLKMPVDSSSKMYIFKDGKFIPNPDYAIPTFDKDGKKSYSVTNADVKTFMDTKPSSDAFYTWATTNNLSPEQIAMASGRPINEISKLFTGGKKVADIASGTDTIQVTDSSGYDTQTYTATKQSDGTYLAANGKKYDADGKEIMADGGLAAMARGGATQFNLGDYSDGGRLLRGPGDGVSDSIPATIGNKRPARLADGEFVVPARIVSELGNGSTEAGARKLYAMMDRIQAARRGTVGKGRVAKNSRADKYLPA